MGMGFPEGMWVQLRKLAEAPGAVDPAADWDEYVPGQWQAGKSLPVAHEMEGVLRAPIVVGQAIELLQTVRNGVPVVGVFRSSLVMRIHRDRVTTLNSVYWVRPLPGAGSRTAVSPAP